MEYKHFDRNFGLQGKVAMITGAANGIGRATAELFAEKGADLVLLDVSGKVKDLAEELSKKFNVHAKAYASDITDWDADQKIVDECVAEFGKIDILANIAGVCELDDAENMPEAYWDKVMLINAKAVFMLSQRVARAMIKSGGGKIVNMASQAGFIALDRHLAYTASKAAVIGMTKVMAMEWAEFNINVNALSPTVVLTELGEKAWSGEVGENMKKLIPAGRFAMPDEIASCLLFLSSDGSNMITGENLVVDGGYTIK